MRLSVLKYAVTLAIVAVPSRIPLQAAPDQSDAGATSFRLERFLWRTVEDKQHHKLGAISDVLAEFPSGKIVFVMVRPDRLYAEPKAVPPSALVVPADQNAPVQLDISPDRWISAPHLGFDPKLVVKDTDDGAKIYGYYQQRWLGTTPHTNNTGLNVVASRDHPTSEQQPTRFVSLQTLKMNRVANSAWKQEGFLCGFVVDWPAHRVAYALVSRLFPPIQPASDPWYAVPVSLLSPPVNRDALTVNSSPEAFERAPQWQPGKKLPANTGTEIFRYPSPKGTLASAEPARR